MNNNIGLVTFWNERFHPDSLHDWFSTFSYEISGTGALVDIDWDKSDTSNIYPGKTWGNPHIKTTASKHCHFVEVKWKEAKNGIKYPIIQFTSHTIGTQFWNGYEALAELNEREGGQRLSDIERERIQQKRLKQEAAIKAKKDHADKMLRIDERHRLQHRANYKKRWESGVFNPELIAQHVYLQKKGIPASVVAASTSMPMAIVTGREFHKNDAGRYAKQARSWLGIPMQNFMGGYVGQQRIYENGKAHARGSDMTQAHFIIGNPQNAKQIEYFEGYATAASTYKTALAEDKGNDIAVIVCFDKRGLTRITKHYQQKWKAKKHIVRADNDHFKWLEGKGNAGMLAALVLQKELGVKATYPTFDSVCIKSKPTDFNDLEMLGGTKIASKQLWGNQVSNLKADKNLFEYRLQLLSYSGQQSWLKNAKAAAAAGAHFIPEQLDRETVLKAIFEAIPSIKNPKTNKKLPVVKIKHGDKKTIRNHLNWVVRKRFKEAETTKNFTEDALKQDNINHIKVQAVLNSAGRYEIPDDVLTMIQAQSGATILKAAHAMGKTVKVMGPLIEANRKANKSGSSMIVHRITLADQMSNELGLIHYQEIGVGEVGMATDLVSVLNSMPLPKFNDFFEQAGLLCIDEATQVLRHNMSGGDAIDTPVKIYNKLLAATRCAKKVLLADADANDSLIDFLQQARPGETINVIEVESPAIDLTIQYCNSVAFVFHKVMELAKANGELSTKNKALILNNIEPETLPKRILVATDHKNKAKAVAEGIKLQWPSARILCVTADTKGEAEVMAFSKDPDNQAKNIDVLIYSPMISSGVSIKDFEACFDRHFGMFHGVVVPSDILQMIRRDRNASNFLVALEPNHNSQQTDRDAMVRGLMNAHALSASTLNWGEDETSIIIKKTPFDEMYLDIKIAEARARNNYSANTLMLMAAEGWKLERVEVTDTEAAVGKSELDASKDMVTLQRHSLINGEQTPEENQYHHLKRSELITQKQAAQIVRYEIENKLGVKVNDETIEFFDSRGLSRIRGLELLQGTQQSVEQVEEWEQQRQVLLTQRRLTLPRWMMQTRVYKTLGLCPLTGAGQFNVEGARAVMTMLTGSAEAIDNYNALNIGPQVNGQPTCPTRFVKGILERIAPVVNGKKVQGVQFYRMHSEKFAELLGYIEARAAIGQNSLIVDTTAELHDDNHTDSMTIKTPQAPVSLACSQGGEITSNTIYRESEFSPQQESMLVSVVEWLKPSTHTTQKLYTTGALGWMGMDGPRTMADLMSRARGWVDSKCKDARWGDVVPMMAEEV